MFHMPNLQYAMRHPTKPTRCDNSSILSSKRMPVSSLFSILRCDTVTQPPPPPSSSPQRKFTRMAGMVSPVRDKKLIASNHHHLAAKLPVSPLIITSVSNNSLLSQQRAANNNDTIRTPLDSIEAGKKKHNNFNNNNNNSNNNNNNNASESIASDAIKPTLKRYIVLFIYCINSGNKAFQWIQIPAATEKLTYYYNVENFVINSMSVLFMLTFVLASWPACYLIEHVGIRKAVVLASFGTSLGSLIKCFSCQENGIYLLFLGQALVSFSEQLIFSVPSRLASVWFPDHQVSSAVAISILGSQLGIAFGFVAPQIALDGAETREAIGIGLHSMLIGTAIFSFLAFLASFALFDEAPKYAPGAARLKQIHDERQQEAMNNLHFLESMRVLGGQIRHLLTNKHFNLLALIYGITIGIGYALQTVLNQMLEPLWPHDDLLIGNTGFIIVISGALCSPLWGRLMDKWHRYLLIYELLSLATIISLLVFGMVVSGMHSKVAIYLAAGLFGSFQTGLLVAGLELAVELTYPAAELVTSSFMNLPPQLFGTVFVFVASYLVDYYGAIVTNLFFILCFIVAIIIMLNITETLKRQKAVVEREKASISAHRC